MKTLKVNFTSVSFIIILVLGFSTESFSCICRSPRAVDFLKANDTLSHNERVVVIKGKVLSNTVGKNIYNGLSYRSYFPIANLKVIEFWPNDGLSLEKSDTITIFEQDPYCSESFMNDSTYLVLAHYSNRYLFTHFCNGLISLNNERAKADLKELGEGTKPEIKGVAKVDSKLKVVNNKNSAPNISNDKILLSFLLLSLALNIFFIIRLFRKK